VYKSLLLPRAQKDLDRFSGKTFDKLCEKLTGLQENPRPPGCQKLTAEEGYRIRSGDYRVVYRINDKTQVVLIYRIKHGEEAY
jgi:mRNA interferase RelE/StbE